MSLSNEQKKRYRTIGHSLNPVVTVAGKGLSPGVLEEINRALSDHELIKIKLALTEREQRQQALKQILEQCDAILVQAIGKVILIFKPAPKPNPKLSNLLR